MEGEEDCNTSQLLCRKGLYPPRSKKEENLFAWAAQPQAASNGGGTSENGISSAPQVLEMLSGGKKNKMGKKEKKKQIKA